MLKPWPPAASLTEIGDAFRRVGYRDIQQLDQSLTRPDLPDQRRIVLTLMKAALLGLVDATVSQFGWFSQLNASARNCKRCRSVIRNSLNIPKL